MSYETLDEFKQNTSLKFPDSVMQDALDEAVKQMQAYIFVPRVYQSYASQVQHILTRLNYPLTSAVSLRGLTLPRELFIADTNADRLISSADLNCYEIDTNYNETSRNGVISSFNAKYGVVNFSIPLPIDSAHLLVIEYSEAKDFLPNILPLMKELNELLAVNWVFQKIPASKLQSGIPEWTINGVSVRFDNAVMNAVMESNRSRIKELFNLLIPTYTVFNQLQAQKFTTRDWARNIGFQSTSGW